MSSVQEISKSRLVIGTIIFALGFVAPLFIPLVTSSDLPIGWKAGLSGFLALGIPEIFMIIAVSIMGKSGFEYLKSRLSSFLKPLVPPDTVSLTRYRIGLIMISLPLLIGWIQPYLGHFFPLLYETPLRYYIIGDVLFFSSFFVLGGDFWDKISGLFTHKVNVSKS